MNDPFVDQLDTVEQQIYGYLNPDNFKSFLLFAGAGSGKTRTLVKVLEEIRKKYVQRFIRSGQQVAIITYTNAACDEIKDRLEHDPVFPVSTIHSFAWRLIKPLTEDIRSRLREKLESDINELDDKINRARDKQGKTAQKNIRKRNKKKSRLDNIDEVSEFFYSPDSTDTRKGSLHHAEVIALAVHFLNHEPLMQNILVNRYPILLIDESQDTDKKLLEALITLQQNYSDRFCLGLFGDMMQRIYGGGKPDLDISLPSDWKKPAKKINYRSPNRIVQLINQIRLIDDNHQQEPRKDVDEGLVRLFIVGAERRLEKTSVERSICFKMAEDTDDQLWCSPEKVKILILEHHMAAQRGRFADFFLPLLKVDSLKDAALKGNGREIQFLKNQLVPLWRGIENQDDFAVANVIRNYSPLLSPSFLKEHPKAMDIIRCLCASVEYLRNLIKKSPRLLDLLLAVSQHDLLVIPDIFYSQLFIKETKNIESEEDAMLEDDKSKVWGEALRASFEQVVRYTDYIDEKLSFGTHQGVKGREFERVMVILDDEEARGWTFNYEKIFGAAPPSGKDSVLKTTRRLFYVTCSRAEKSLAVVAYTKNSDAVKNYAVQAGWLKEEEIVCC
jgi:DNA helicase-2/ATP-dependent DNA helicase PcrA